MAKKSKGRPRSTDPCKYHYNFKLNEAQNKRFLAMLCDQHSADPDQSVYGGTNLLRINGKLQNCSGIE